MAKIRITQTRSQIGQSGRHRGTLRALGLGKIGKTVEHDDGRMEVLRWAGVSVTAPAEAEVEEAVA